MKMMVGNKNINKHYEIINEVNKNDYYVLNWFDKAKEDYFKLDGEQIIFVDKALNRIKIMGMEAGQQLYGKLHNCRKLKNRKKGLRIVFKEGDSSKNIDIIDIIVIGKRKDDEVYLEAEKRLNDKI
ncbi:addiction module toxin RelE [Clostridium kluyveri]|uniref:addiction module toxin RelE n=1 Tax=Clostridium kluyveri TaxID=1534 RepID=UPI0009F933E6|nr:addiction module toxin RelE [Clostridium kluyveri]